MGRQNQRIRIGHSSGSTRRSPPKNIRLERNSRNIGRHSPFKKSCYAASIRNNRNITKYNEAIDTKVAPEKIEQIEKTFSNTVVINMDLGTNEEEVNDLDRQESTETIQAVHLPKREDDSNSAKYRLAKNDNNSTVTKETERDKDESLTTKFDIDVTKLLSNKRVRQKLAFPQNFMNKTKNKDISFLKESHTKKFNSKISQLNIRSGKKTGCKLPTKDARTLPSNKGKLTELVTPIACNSIKNINNKETKKTYTEKDNSSISHFNNCGEKETSCILPATDVTKVSPSKNEFQELATSFLQNFSSDKEISDSTQPKIIPMRDPRLHRNDQNKEINGEQEKSDLCHAASETKPVLTNEHTVNNELVDLRANHIEYNILKTQPSEPKKAEFLKECKKYIIKSNNLRDYRHIKKSNIVKIRYRSSVCCENINKLRRFYKKPITELMKFCCHVNIRRNECKYLPPEKSPDINIPLKRGIMEPITSGKMMKIDTESVKSSSNEKVPARNASISHVPEENGISNPWVENDTYIMKSLESQKKYRSNTSTSVKKSSLTNILSSLVAEKCMKPNITVNSHNQKYFPVNHTCTSVCSTSQVCEAQQAKEIPNTSVPCNNDNAEVSTERKAEMLLDELTKDIDPKTPSDCSGNNNKALSVDITSNGDIEYSLHISEGSKSNSSSDSDISSEELLSNLEETIEGMISPIKASSLTDINKGFQENHDLPTNQDEAYSFAECCSLGVQTKELAANSASSDNKFDEDSPKSSDKLGETTLIEKKVSENKDIAVNPARNNINYSNYFEQGVGDYVANNDTFCEKSNEAKEDDGGVELLLQVRAIENPEIKKEQELDSIQDLSVNLFCFQPEIKTENIESSSNTPTSNPVLVPAVSRINREDFQTIRIESTAPKQPVRTFINPIIMDNISTETQCVNANGNQDNSVLGLSQYAKSSSPFQSQRISTEVKRTTVSTRINTTSEITRTDDSEKTSFVSKSVVTTQKNNSYLNPSKPIISAAFSNTHINVTTIKNKIAIQEEQSNSPVAGSVGMSITYPSLNSVATYSSLSESDSIERGRRMPQLSNIATSTNVNQGKSNIPPQSGTPTEFFLGAFKIVKGYIISKSSFRHLVSCLESLNRIHSLESELRNVMDAISKIKGIFADVLLKYMRELRHSTSNHFMLVSFLMDFLVRSMSNDKEKPFLSTHIWELVSVHSMEYEKTSTLKYFKNYIQNDVKAQQNISGTSMTIEQYMILKSQIYHYLRSLVTPISENCDPNCAEKLSNCQNPRQNVTRQSVSNKSCTNMENLPQYSVNAINNGNTKAPTSSSISKNVLQQNRKIENDVNIRAHFQQGLPGTLAENRKRSLGIPCTTYSLQQHHSTSKSNNTRTGNSPKNTTFPKAKPSSSANVMNAAHLPTIIPITGYTQTIGNENIVSSRTGVLTVTSRIDPKRLRNRTFGGGLYSNVSSETSVSITSSKITPNCYPNQTFGNELNKNIGSPGTSRPITSSRITTCNIPNQTYSGEINRNLNTSGVGATITSSRITANSFPSPTCADELKKFIIASKRSVSKESSTITTNSFPNQIFIRNIMPSVDPILSYTKTPIGYQSGKNGELYLGISPPVTGIPTQTTKRLPNTTRNEKYSRGILEDPRNENLSLGTGVPIPFSSITPKTPQSQAYMLEAKKRREFGGSVISALPSPRELCSYPTPPTSNENAALGNIEDMQLTNPANERNSTNEVTTSIQSPSIGNSEMKPIVASPSTQCLVFDPERSMNPNEPVDMVDWTRFEDDKVKLEPSHYGSSLILEGEEEALLLSHNRKCLCGAEAIYACACNTVVYCTQQCQFKDWENHQRNCLQE